jgi:hypothetical protein
MNETERDPRLLALFAEADQVPTDTLFTARTIGKVQLKEHRRLIVGAGIGVIGALLAIPLQDAAVPVAQFVLTSVVEVDNQLLAQILAPINSVGAVLSAVLLLTRAAHRRLFR